MASAGGIEGKSGIRAEAIRKNFCEGQHRYASAYLGLETDPAPRGIKPVAHANFRGMAKAMPGYELLVAQYRRLKKPSILRQLRVHAFGPGVNSPSEIVDFRESRLAQEINRLGAAPAHLAVGDDLAAGVEFVHAPG